MAQIKGDLTAVNSTLVHDSVDHFGSADVNGAVGITLVAGASGTVVLEVSGGTGADGVTEQWVQVRVFNDTAGVGAYQDAMVRAAGAQHFYAEIVGVRHIRVRKTITVASCYVIMNLKAA